MKYSGVAQGLKHPLQWSYWQTVTGVGSMNQQIWKVEDSLNRLRVTQAARGRRNRIS
jgi:hypothetical protein